MSNIFIGTMLFLLLVSAVSSLNWTMLVSGDINQSDPNTVNQNNPINSKIVSDRIEIEYMYINGNEELLQMAEENDWPGTGYEWDPILIQGYYFRGTVHLFVVDNTDLYWEFSNNILDGIDERYCIIVIGNVQNCKISNNRFLNGAVGIHSIRVHDCSFVGNEFYNQSWDGILLENSYNNIVLSNTFHDNGEGGVLAWEQSHGNNIGYNRIYGCPYGILLWSGSGDNLIQHNTMYNLSFLGIDVQTADNRIIDNIIHDVNGDGITIADLGTEITDSLIHNNTGYGIRVSTAGGEAVIQDNVLINNAEGGIQLTTSQDNLIERNDLYENSENQAWDYGESNRFQFNYWHEWIGNDTNANGIIDTPKQIPGSAYNADKFPKVSPNNPIPSWYDFTPITGPPEEPEPNPEPTETTSITETSSTTIIQTSTTTEASTTQTRTDKFRISIPIIAVCITVALLVMVILIQRMR